MSEAANHQESSSTFIDSEFLYQNAPSGHLSLDGDGRILRLNNTLSSWLGVSKLQIEAANFTAFLTKGSSLYYQMIVAPLLSLHGAVNEINLSMVNPEGNIEVLFNAIAYKNAAGKIHVINATIIKISDRKKFEKELMTAKNKAEAEKRRFQFLSNTVPNMIWTALPDGRIDFINDRVKEYFPSMDNAVTQTLTGIYKLDRQGFWREWKRCLQTGEVFDKEVRLVPPMGDPEWFIIHAVPFHNEEGELELWFGSSTNINRQKQLQLARYSSLSTSLLTANKKITENKGMFEEIAFSQSHLIRKPAANIIGLIPLLRMEPLTEDGSKVVDLLAKSAAELDNLIKEVVSKSANGLSDEI
jgi:PAS domain-containing protein